jgi:phage shock protein A
MGFFNRLSRVVRANANAAVSKAENPELILEQALVDMQADLTKLRAAVATAIAAQKRLEQQHADKLADAKVWADRAVTALQSGNEELARQALERKSQNATTAKTLEVTLSSYVTQVETLKRNLSTLEQKIAEAKTKKDMLKARAQAATAQEQLQSVLTGVGTGTDSAMAAFESMETKVLAAESRSAAFGELAGSNLEAQFAALEGSSDVDQELAKLKASLSPALPPAPASEIAPAVLEPADDQNAS